MWSVICYICYNILEKEVITRVMERDSAGVWFCTVCIAYVSCIIYVCVYRRSGLVFCVNTSL